MAGDEDDEVGLFRRTMLANGVREAESQSSNHTHPKKASAAIKPRNTAENLLTKDSSQSTLPSTAIDQTDGEAELLYVRQGVDKNKVRQMRRGQMGIDETIDLHGMRSEEAVAALERFLEEAVRYRWQTLQIIHGKGRGSEQKGGVLKPLTIQWLKKQPEVRMFCAAQSSQGGGGATNVLLQA